MNTQAFNRYAYVYNNPLTLTDSSGFSPDGEDTCWFVCFSWPIIWPDFLDYNDLNDRMRDFANCAMRGGCRGIWYDLRYNGRDVATQTATTPVDKKAVANVGSGASPAGAAMPAAAVLRTPQGRAAAVAGTIVLTGSLYVVSHSRTAGFFARPDYSSEKPELVLPSSGSDLLSGTGSPNPCPDPENCDTSDPGLSDFVSRLTRARPDAVRNTNVRIFRADGTVSAEVDIVTRRVIIEFKSGAGRAGPIVHQVARLEAQTTRPVIVYGEELSARTIARLQRRGIRVVNNLDDLLKILDGM